MLFFKALQFVELHKTKIVILALIYSHHSVYRIYYPLPRHLSHVRAQPLLAIRRSPHDGAATYFCGRWLFTIVSILLGLIVTTYTVYLFGGPMLTSQILNVQNKVYFRPLLPIRVWLKKLLELQWTPEGGICPM